MARRRTRQRAPATTRPGDPRPAAAAGRSSTCRARHRRSSATSAARPGAPTVVLLHGWTATADLNWFTCYQPLGEHYRVVALDHRGHGRGIRSRKTFRWRTAPTTPSPSCDVLGIDRFIAVGYSMGGPVAQLLWRRHPELVDGPGALRHVGVLLGRSRGAARLHRPRRPGRRRPAHARPGDARG